MVGKSKNSVIGNIGGKKFGGVQQPYNKQRVNNIWMNRGSNSGHGHISISNLHHKVDDDDIRNLFMEFGKITSAAVQYNQAGRSSGTALVKFQRHADAVRALERYDGVPLDGRPMKIQIPVSDTPSVFDRLSLNPIKKFNGPRHSKYQTKLAPRRHEEWKFYEAKPHQKPMKRESNVVNKKIDYVKVDPRTERTNGRKASYHKKPTREELDAELDAYMQGNPIRKFRKIDEARARDTIVDNKPIDKDGENVAINIDNVDPIMDNEVSEADLYDGEDTLIENSAINDDNALIGNVDADITNDNEVIGSEVVEDDLYDDDDETLIDNSTINDGSSDATINSVIISILINQDNTANDSVNDVLNDSFLKAMDVD